MEFWGVILGILGLEFWEFGGGIWGGDLGILGWNFGNSGVEFGKFKEEFWEELR